MSGVTRLRTAALLAAFVWLLGAVPAMAGVYDDYRRTGRINPCRYSDGQLRRGLNGLPPDIKQYAPGLVDQLSAGREGCGAGAGPGGSTDTRQLTVVPVPPSAGGGGTKKAKVPTPPGPKPGRRLRLGNIATPAVADPHGSDAPGWLLPLLLALTLGAALVALARTGGLSSRRLTRPLRASFAEAGGRTADGLAELWDSVRLGR